MRSLSIALLAAICLGQAAAAQTPSESPAPGATSAPGAGPQLWLSGPFGRVPADVQLAAGPDGGERILDAWAQSAPLALDLAVSPATFRSWTVTSDDATGAGPRELARGSGEERDLAVVPFAGPELPGSYRIVAKAVTTDGGTLDGTWQIEVPDRPFPQDGVLDIPAPAALLKAAGASTTGWPGHGCYVFLCVEIGLLPPAESFDVLAVAAGEVMELRLSDGSGFTLDQTSFTSLDDGDTWAGGTAQASQDPAQHMEITAPPPGGWLLELEIVYDRERGFSETVFRLVSGDVAS